MTRSAQWIDSMRRIAVPDVAARLGIEEIGRTPGDWCLGPCPACKAEKRHSKSRDPRGALNVPKGTPVFWVCLQCDERGDAVDLVSYCIAGSRFRDASAPRKIEVREWCCRMLGLEPGTPREFVPLVPRAPRPEAAPSYPPSDEVAALWGGCVPIAEDAAAWLTSRGIDPAAVVDADLARELPATFTPFRWMQHKVDPAAGPETTASWGATSHRAIVPLYDATGAMRSVLARPLVPSPRKSTTPSRFARAGLVMANPIARRMLERTASPRIVIVCEGETDYLLTAVGPATLTRWPGEPPAVLGMFQGGWSAEPAARVPDGANVIIATDNDPDGDKYAARIASTLEARARIGRVKVERWRPKK